MKGQNASIRLQRAKYVTVDWLTANVAFFLFNIWRFYILWGGDGLEHFLSSPKIILEQIFIPIGLLGAYWLSGYYNCPFAKSRMQEFSSTFFTVAFCSLALFFLLLTNDLGVARKVNFELLLCLFGTLFLFTYAGRLSITQHALANLKKRNWCFNTVIIGNSDKAVNAAKRFNSLQTNLGYNVIGHLPIEGETESQLPHKTITPAQRDLLAAEHHIDQFIIIPENNNEENSILKSLYTLFHLDIPVKISPLSLSLLTSTIRLQDIYGEPFVDLTSPSMSEMQKNFKRVIDIFTATTALTLLSPLFLALAIGVKISSPGAAIYSQQRIGYRHKPFRIHKFRTMRTDAENGRPMLSSDDDPRVTPFGKILRKYRLDELPQFWNILKGEMSLVGPRPERAYFIDKIVKKAPYYTLVHKVKPGLTSWGMVKYGYARNVDEMVKRTRYDILYLSNMSIIVDFKILIHTVKTVVSGRGV